MRFWKSKSRSADQAAQQSGPSQQSNFMPGYLRLEQRTLLSATFATFGTTAFVLNDFDVGQDLDFAQQDAIVNGISQDSYVFQVASGSFTGATTNPLIELESVNGGTNNQLEIATSFFQGGAANAQLTINGLATNGTNVEFTQSSSNLTFDTLALSNFANDNSDFDLNATGDVSLENVTVFDSDTTDALTAPAAFDVSVDGNLNLDELTGNLISSPNADVALSASGNITSANSAELTSTQAIALSSTGGSITLADVSAGDSIQVQSANNITQLTDSQIDASTSVDFTATNGTATLAGITAGTDIRIQAADDIVQLANSQVDANASTDFIANNGDITLADVAAGDDFQIQAANDIVQLTNSDITVGTSATFTSTDGNIVLAAAPNQTINVQGQATFSANEIEIGLDGEAAGSTLATNVNFGSTSLNASRAVLVEDDATLFSGNSNVTDLFVSSAQEIGNATGASLASTDAQLNSATNIVLGNQTGDSISLDQVSLIADNAHLEVDSDLVINGTQPTAANSQPIATGTAIDQNLFVIADGSVEQTQGDLLAQQIGIEATEYVHLTSIAAANQAIAISAGGSRLLTDPTLEFNLDSLAAVQNGEVDSNRPQAISIAHRGDVNVTNVTSVTGIDSLTGFNSTDGSISVFADQTISLQQDITAFSPVADPQVTLYSAAGDATNPGVFFDGGQASVTGPTNVGVVNSNQVFANFFDDDGFLFEDTTQILILNTDGSVSQDIVIEYGQLGEVGFRIGVIFDSQNQPSAPIEPLNLFTPSNTVDSEAFEDDIFQQNTVIRALIGGNEGGRETISQVDDFSAQAVITHFDNPNVFTDIIIRNDQDINLFSGPLATVDNSLNETTQQILSIFDLPRGAAPDLPIINPINSIEVRPTFDLPFDSPPPIDQSDSIFDREVAPFENGELRWVQAEIPVDEIEVMGDEVVLKQPSKLYPAVDDFNEQVFENVGENETDRIIDQIERSPAAEPGYWYRVFKAYDNRGDELFFYHYKTGEIDDLPSDPSTGDEEPEKATPDNIDDTIFDRDELESQNGSEAGRNDSSNHTTITPDTNNHSRPVVANEILMGLLQRDAQQTVPTTEHNSPTDTDSPNDDSTLTQATIAESYDRLSRLKRKLKRYL